MFVRYSYLATTFGLGYGVVTTQAAEHHNKTTKSNLKLTNGWTAGDRSKYKQVLENEMALLFSFPHRIFPDDEKRGYCCTRCGQPGHNVRTCKEEM